MATICAYLSDGIYLALSLQTIGNDISHAHFQMIQSLQLYLQVLQLNTVCATRIACEVQWGTVWGEGGGGGVNARGAPASACRRVSAICRMRMRTGVRTLRIAAPQCCKIYR